MKQDKKRINTMMPVDIVKKLDTYANEMGLSRGNALSVIVKHYFDQQEGLKAIRNVDELLEDLKSNQRR
jgi:metal-responsive CopG/Arc/MetJ family transcriptional regulator